MVLIDRDKVVLDVVLKWYYGMAKEKQREVQSKPDWRPEESAELIESTLEATDELMVRVMKALQDFEMK